MRLYNERKKKKKKKQKRHSYNVNHRHSGYARTPTDSNDDYDDDDEDEDEDDETNSKSKIAALSIIIDEHQDGRNRSATDWQESRSNRLQQQRGRNQSVDVSKKKKHKRRHSTKTGKRDNMESGNFKFNQIGYGDQMPSSGDDLTVEEQIQLRKLFSKMKDDDTPQRRSSNYKTPQNKTNSESNYKKRVARDIVHEAKSFRNNKSLKRTEKDKIKQNGRHIHHQSHGSKTKNRLTPSTFKLNLSGSNLHRISIDSNFSHDSFEDDDDLSPPHAIAHRAFSKNALDAKSVTNLILLESLSNQPQPNRNKKGNRHNPMKDYHKNKVLKQLQESHFNSNSIDIDSMDFDNNRKPRNKRGKTKKK
eukprot:253405_1